jgi:hypothetical protein
MLPLIRTTFLLIPLSVSIIGHAQKRQFGRYLNPKRYWTDEFIFKEDLTFIYKCKNRTNDNIEFYDSSFGRYSFVGDTIILNYLANNYHPYNTDSQKDSVIWATTEKHGYFGNRPQKLYWRKKRLYYIFENTGEIFWNKELYMRFIR